MKISINTNDGEGYSIILDELNSLSEVINYINTHLKLESLESRLSTVTLGFSA